MSLHRVQNIVIGTGGALPAGNLDANITNIASPKLAVTGEDNQTLTAGDTISDTEWIKLVQAKADGSLKFTQKISGKSITSYKAETYSAGSRQVVALGYNRKTAAGLLEINTDTWYSFSLLFKNDKLNYSERPYRRSFQIKTGTTDTQDVLAARIALAINNDALASNGGSSQATAIIVGNGTTTSTVTLNGVSYVVYGGTGATAWGVEITGKVLTQFNTSYKEERVYFEVFFDSTTGFGATTTKSVINAMTYGNGTYLDIYNKENFDFGYEGVVNRVKWPIPTLTYSASSTLTATTIVPTATLTVAGDLLTMSATIAGMLSAGDMIEVNNVAFEIKYFISATVGVLTSPGLVASGGLAVEQLVGYDQIIIEFGERTINQGADVVSVGSGSVVIAAPAGIAASAYTVNSVQVDDLMSVLNPYMNSLGFDSVTL